MNYPESSQILSEIEKAQRILLNCHNGPDADSVGSACSFYDYLISLGKSVDIVCPDEVPQRFKFIKHSEKVRKIDFQEIDTNSYDLFIALDSSQWQQISGSPDVALSMKIIIIDHHKTNEKLGIINLIEPIASSTTEVIYRLFEDFKFEIGTEVATSLLSGILADTSFFQYSNTTPRAMRIAADLIEKGGDRDIIEFNILRQIELPAIRLLGYAATNFKVDEEHKFGWFVMPYEIYREIGEPPDTRVTDTLLHSVVGTNFSIRIIEKIPNEISVSFRARINVDISHLARELGGGGHATAAGATMRDIKLDDAVDKVLSLAKSFNQ